MLRRLQPLQKGAGVLGAGGKIPEDAELLQADRHLVAPQMPPLQKGEVLQLLQDVPQLLGGVLPRHPGQHPAHPAQPSALLAGVAEAVQDVPEEVIGPGGNGGFGDVPGDAAAQAVVDLPEEPAVPRGQGQPHQAAHLAGDGVPAVAQPRLPGEEGDPPAAEGPAQADTGKAGAVEDGAALPRRQLLQQAGDGLVLLLLGGLPADPDGRALLPAGEDLLGVPLAAAANHPGGPGHNGPGAAVVLLQLLHPSPGVILPKAEQPLGPGPPEAVDALVLVPHQKEVVPDQLPDDAVLEPGDILGLVGQDVVVPPGDPLPEGGAPPQGGIGKEEHIVKVHEAVFPLIGRVAGKEPGEDGKLPGQLPRLFRRQLHIDAVAHGVDGPAQQVIGEVFPGFLPVKIPQQGGPLLPLPPALHQGGEDGAPARGVFPQQAEAEAVDGGKARGPGEQLPKQALPPPGHIPGRFPVVGEDQHPPGIGAVVCQKLRQPGAEDGGLARPGHRQQQGAAGQRLRPQALLVRKEDALLPGQEAGDIQRRHG